MSDHITQVPMEGLETYLSWFPAAASSIDLVEMFGGASGAINLLTCRGHTRGGGCDLVTNWDMPDENRARRPCGHLRCHKPRAVPTPSCTMYGLLATCVGHPWKHYRRNVVNALNGRWVVGCACRGTKHIDPPDSSRAHPRASTHDRQVEVPRMQAQSDRTRKTNKIPPGKPPRIAAAESVVRRIYTRGDFMLSLRAGHQRAGRKHLPSDPIRGRDP